MATMQAFKDSKVTVLDDDKLVCEYLTQIIQTWGLSAEGFTQHKTALENIRCRKPDIILLDVFIGDVCGLDLIPQFGDDLKIIIMTGFTDKDMAIRALKLGAFDLLEKPFQSELLYHAILRALTALRNERKTEKLIDDLRQSQLELLAEQARLEDLNAQLLGTNRALSIFAQNVEREREDLEKRIALKLRNLVIPIVASLRRDQATSKHIAQLDMLAMQIEDVTSAFTVDYRLAATLSTTEVRIASLIKNGLKVEEIARRLHISENTVRSHRKNIRKKLKIDNAQYSLRNFLNSKTLRHRLD